MCLLYRQTLWASSPVENLTSAMWFLVTGHLLARVILTSSKLALFSWDGRGCRCCAGAIVSLRVLLGRCHGPKSAMSVWTSLWLVTARAVHSCPSFSHCSSCLANRLFSNKIPRWDGAGTARAKRSPQRAVNEMDQQTGYLSILNSRKPDNFTCTPKREQKSGPVKNQMRDGPLFPVLYIYVMWRLVYCLCFLAFDFFTKLTM